jgi:hypothetical protein
MASKSDHITKVRQASKKLIDAMDELRALKRESDALDLGKNLADGDFVGENQAIVKADVVAAYAALAAIEQALASVHAASLYKIKP